MSKISEFKQEFRNYLYTIYKQESISSQETEMCLNSFAKYLLGLKNINLSEDKLVIHKVKPSFFASRQTAKMEHENGKFDIYLNKDNLKITHIEELEIIISIFVSCAHEIQHVIQYINAPHMMQKYNNKLFDLEQKLDFAKINIKSRKDRRLLKKLRKLYEDNLTVSAIELNATFRAYQNFLNLLTDLKETENNKKFSAFINLVMEQLKWLYEADYVSDNIALNEAQKNVDNLVNTHNQDPETTIVF